jgi:hypothetical protein
MPIELVVYNVSEDGKERVIMYQNNITSQLDKLTSEILSKAMPFINELSKLNIDKEAGSEGGEFKR